MIKLAGKSAVVIGGHDGIGGVIAERFPWEGGTVYATSRRALQGEKPHGEGILRAHCVDASDVVAFEQFFERVRSKERQVDIHVVSAGLSEPASLQEVTEDHTDRAFGLDVRALVFATRAATAVISEGGSVMLVGPIADTIVIKS